MSRGSQGGTIIHKQATNNRKIIGVGLVVFLPPVRVQTPTLDFKIKIKGGE